MGFNACKQQVALLLIVPCPSLLTHHCPPPPPKKMHTFPFAPLSFNGALTMCHRCSCYLCC